MSKELQLAMEIKSLYACYRTEESIDTKLDELIELLKERAE